MEVNQFMRILVATNSSSQDKVTLRFGAQITRCANESLTILTVVRNELDRIQAERSLARDCELLAAKGLWCSEGLDVQRRVRMGNPAVEIIREAEEGSYELVIVGERQNRSLVRRFLLGSTTVRVVEHAPCAVIVAKGKTGPVRRILLCDSGAKDLSIEHRAGQSLINQFAQEFADLLRGDEEVVTLHVMSQISAGPGVIGKQLRSNAEELIGEHTPEGELLGEDLQVLKRLGFHAHAKVRHGLVVEEILDEAKSGDYDLVVIGAYRGEGWQRILLDDQAHRILVQLDRPVLVLR
jgi:nucleotide-binding universal stress UspA family protein